jgi:hypothetical protein
MDGAVPKFFRQNPSSEGILTPSKLQNLVGWLESFDIIDASTKAVCAEMIKVLTHIHGAHSAVKAMITDKTTANWYAGSKSMKKVYDCQAYSNLCVQVSQAGDPTGCFGKISKKGPI